MGILLLIVVVILLVGAQPRWRHSRDWGYRPAGILGVIAVVLVILMLTGQMHVHF